MQHRRSIITALVIAAALPFGAEAQDSCAAVASNTSNVSREESDREAQGTIAEARRVRGDFEKCRTLGIAIQQTRSVTTAKLLFEAATALDGDFELAEILIASAARGLLEARTADAYFAATRTIESDFQKARALAAALRAKPDDAAVVQGVLRTAPAVADDFQLASLLVAAANAAPIRGTARELYGAAARTLQNQWEYRRAMHALNR